jgi:glycosyltransferase involved in cell wall biosynthesis
VYDDTWLIVPVYNEEQVIEKVVREAQQSFPNIVCVDDGSRDASAHCVHASGAHLVQHPVNLGQGAALQTGIEYARGQPGARYFVTFDSDGQHQVADVLRMLSRLQDGSADMVIGTRFGGTTGYIPWKKRATLRTLVFLSPRLRKLGLTDIHNGLRVFNRNVADGMRITCNGMGHASEILTMAAENEWSLAEEPVTIRYTEYSMAKGQSLFNGVNIFFENLVNGLRRS